MVARYSNNQNGVKSRDFKANNPIQIRLKLVFELQEPWATHRKYQVFDDNHA